LLRCSLRVIWSFRVQFLKMLQDKMVDRAVGMPMLIYNNPRYSGYNIHPQFMARLVEAVQNLIDNASKYMGKQPNPLIEIGQQGEDDGKPIFFVRDNGIGISHEYHERIFGLFNKLDPRSEGTGIGLSLVKKIIELHGGRIWVESELGKGATFYFTLRQA